MPSDEELVNTPEPSAGSGDAGQAGEASAAPATTQRRSRHRVRKVTTAILVVLTSISVVAATVAYWAHRTVFDTDRYVALVGPLVEDPAVARALSNYLTTQTTEALDLENRISNALGSVTQLPDQLQLLAGPIANAANNEVHQVITNFIHSDTFRNLWVRVNTVGHEKVVALLRGDYDQLPNVSVEGAEVNLNLLPIISQILREVAQRAVGLVAPNVTIPTISVNDIPDQARERLQQALGVSLPPDFGQVTIMSSEKLHDLQSVAKTFDKLVWLLIILCIVLAAATILVAVRRRRAVVQLAVGIAVGLLIAAVAIRRISDRVVDAVKSADGRGAARNVLAEVVHNVRTIGAVVLVTVILVAIAAYLAGRPRWLRRTTAWFRPAEGGSAARRWAAGHVDLLRVVAIGLGVLVLALIGVGWISFLLVAALVGLFLWWLSTLAPPAAASEPAPGSPAIQDAEAAGAAGKGG